MHFFPNTKKINTFLWVFLLSLSTALYAKNSAVKHEMMMDMSTMSDMSNAMHGMYALYPMTREISGTSWQPQSTPLLQTMKMTPHGMYMYQGYITQVYDHQGGPRGGNMNFSSSMFMFMAQKDLNVGTLGFRSMVSLDPLMGPGGYPLLLQTGETANGQTPLIDRQHPHDALMELAGTYSIPLSEKKSVFMYAGIAGEPALGPPAFMMRWTGYYNPEAPITHHWLDSTHVTYGVVTLGYIIDKIKLEFSSFNGREPNQSRWNIESPKLDSESGRITFNPTDNWSLQASYGHLKSPEQLEPESNTNRATISVMYNQPFGAKNNWQTIVAWGQDKNYPGHTLNGYLLESAVSLSEKHIFFTRLEHVQKDELFIESSPFFEQVFNVNELSAGYLYQFPSWHFIKPGLGFLVSTYALPGPVQSAYGSRPFSYMLFGRVSLA